jgi:hypothetical protein
VVGSDWQPGQYRLRAELWQADTVVASQETPPLLTIFNKQPHMMTPPSIQQPLKANFAHRLNLLGYDIPWRFIEAGQPVPITLYWQADRTMVRNYTFFTKLFDDQNRLWSSVDRFARDGYKTTHWHEGEIVIDQFTLPTPSDIPPGVYRFNVGAYLGLEQTTVYLPLVEEGQPTEATSLTFGSIKIGGPPPGLVVDEASPQYPMSVDLAGAIRLQGYDMSPIDQNLGLKLYWESLAPVETDYTIFAHLRNQAGQTVAQMDRPPAAGAYPTSLWSPGEIIPDEVIVPWPQNLQPGQYSIVVGLYDFTTGIRLPVVGSNDNSIELSTVKIR